MSKPKICMITTREEPGDPRVFEKEARSLKEAGFDIEIVGPKMKLPANTYGIRFLQFEKAPRPFRKLSTVIRTYKTSKKSNAQIYHCHEIDVSLFIGYLLKKLRRRENVKLIFDCHEFWLAYFSDRIPVLFRWLFRSVFTTYEKIILKHCDFIITANTIERGYYQTFFPLKDISVIYNVPHLTDTNGSVFDPTSPPQKIYDLCYEGYINFERGIEIFFELIRRLKKRYGNIKFLIIGNIAPGQSQKWAEQFIKENHLEENITVTGWQPYSKLYSYHLQSKIGIFLYQHSPNNILAGPPNKLFNFMKAGLPIIASNLPETVNILDEIGSGITVRPDNIDEIERAALKLLENPELREEMGQKGLKAFQEKYNWQKEEQRLIQIYRKILNSIDTAL